MPSINHMLPFVLIFPYAAVAAPIDTQSVVISLPIAAAIALLWSSIGLAVLTALLQGLVTTMATVAEDAGMWTCRFRIARYEHLWYTLVSVLLSSSLVLIVLSFMAGNNGEAVSILALSSATAVTVVRYTVPAWRTRHFINNRWLAWTGKSRTSIDKGYARLCGDTRQWEALWTKVRSKVQMNVASDEWGPTWRQPSGLAADATAILNKISQDEIPKIASSQGQNSYSGPLGMFVYDDGLHHVRDNVSLLWGPDTGFRRRVSRGVASMPLNLLKSIPLTVDNYAGEGLCLAMGVLGRNKGLEPQTLVYDFDDSLKTHRGVVRNGPRTIASRLEDTSTWQPRPGKVLRSYYTTTMVTQYSTISKAFVAAAVELALIFNDCSNDAIRVWFEEGCEQQSWQLNYDLQRETPKPSPAEMNALYRSSYVSMIISLNYFKYAEPSSRHDYTHLIRPDLHCMALLLMSEKAAKPQWWSSNTVQSRLKAERSGLNDGWRDPMAWLLGLAWCPVDSVFSEWHEYSIGSEESKFISPGIAEPPKPELRKTGTIDSSESGATLVARSPTQKS